MLLAFFAAARPAHAYGALGHQVVGALAEGMLTPKAKAQVRALLATSGNGSPESLATVSTWADEIRMLRPATRPWHYVTLQIGDPRYDSAKADSADIVKALKRQLAVLAMPGADRYAREEALKWTVHLVGDLHQPLHTGEDRDKGGNLAKVKVNRRTHNLHEVWDHVLLERLNLSRDGLRGMLEREIARDPGFILRNAKGTVEDWVDETHAKAARCYILRGKRMPKGIKAQLNREYVRAATLTVLEQLKIAGVRLAFALNAALDPAGAAVPVPAARVAVEPKARLDAPSESGARGGTSEVEAYFAHADAIQDAKETGADESDTKADKNAGPGGAKSAEAGGAFAWSVHSRVYHRSDCPDVQGIKRKNQRTGKAPPLGFKPHAACLGSPSRAPSRAEPSQERVK